MNYIPHTREEQARMLSSLGVETVDELFGDIPPEIRLKRPLDLPGPMAELELARYIQSLAHRNRGLDRCISFLGGGIYEHFIPSIVHHLTSRTEFYTAYTPYQPEISQGTLQAIYEYQSMICALTGMDVANASMYDGASALAEGVRMAAELTGRREVICADSLHPEYRQVVQTYGSPQGIRLNVTVSDKGVWDLNQLESRLTSQTAAVIVQNPNFFGLIEEPAQIAEAVHRQGALLIVIADPLSLGILKPPGDYGADIVAGEGQGLGNPPSFGGPLLGFFACREKMVRRMPGRLVGMTSDRKGKRGFVLTLQAREQHIRRSRATSNICSNEALNGLAATVYLAAMGKQGLREVALNCLRKSHYAFRELTGLPWASPVFTGPFFKEFVLRLDIDPDDLNKTLLAAQGIIGGLPLQRFYPDRKSEVLLAVTEVRTRSEIDALVGGVRAFMAGKRGGSGGTVDFRD